MAEEYDPEEGYDPGSEPLPGSAPVSDAQILQEIAAADRLTQSQQPGQPGQTGGGPEGNYGSPQALPPPPQQVALPLVNPAASYRLLGQSQPASFTGAPPPTQKRERTYQPAKPDYDLVGESQAAGGAFAPPPPPEPGFATRAMDIFSRGLLRANEDVKQSAQVTTGNKPVASAVPQEDYEQPPSLADFGSPSLLAAKAWYVLARSYPTVAATIAGSVAGGMIGGAVGTAGGAAAGGVPAVVTGPGGAAIGAGIGGVAGAGIAGAWQSLGPAYLSELQKLPPNPTAKQTDEAWDAAMAEVAKSGVVSAASMALFTAGKPVGNFLKGFFTKAATTTAAPVAAPVVAGLPTRIGVQAIGQPVISVGGQAGYNIATGKPAGEGLSEAAAGGLLNVLPDAAGRLGARALGYGRPRPGDLVNPTTTGLPSDVEAALGRLGPPGAQGALDLTGGSAAQPRLDLTGGADTRPVRESPVTGGRGEGVGEVRMATGGMGPSRPGELVGAGDLRNQTALDLTGGRGPDQGDLFNRQTPQPPTPPVPRGTYPEGPVVQPPVPGLNRVNIGDTNVAAAAPIQQGAADILRRTGVRNVPGETLFAGFEGSDQVPPTGPMAVRDPIGRVGPEPVEPTYRGTVQQPGQGELNLPAGSYRPVGPTKYGVPTPAAVSPRPKWSDFSVEKDHLDASRWVAKNESGDVAGKGASQQAARADAVARRGKVYPPEPGETAAAKAGVEMTVKEYVDKYRAGEGRDDPAMEQFHANNAEAIEKEFARQKAAEDAAASTKAAEAEPAPAKTRKEINAENLARGRATAKANREAKAAEKAKAAEMAAEPRTQGGQIRASVRKSTPGTSVVGRYPRKDAGTGPVKPAAEAAAAPDEQASSRAGETVTESVAESVRKNAPAETVTETTEAAAEKAPEGETVTKSDTEKSVPAKTAKTAKTPIERAQERVEAIRAKVDELQELRKSGKSAISSQQVEEMQAVLRRAEKEHADLIEAEVTTSSKALDAAVERAQAAYDEATNEYQNHRITKAELTDAERTLNAAKKAAERTKSGAFSMGEGEEVVPLTDAERQRQSSGMASEAGAVIRGELEKQRREQLPQPKAWRPTEGANKIRQGMEIVAALSRGDISLDEALGHYGVKLPGTQGRPRKYESLSAVAREALRAAKDPSVEDKIRRNMENMRRVGRVATDDYKNLKAQLDLLEQARTNKAGLEALVKELEARDRGLPPSPESAVPDIINEAKARAERDRLQYAASLPEVNAPLQKRLESGATHKLHDLLNEILGTHAINKLAPQFHELATILRRILPNLDVVANNHLVGERGGPIYGQYNSVRGVIEINPVALKARPSGGAVMTLLHEALHGATTDYVDHIFGTAEHLLNPTELAHKRALETVLGEINRILAEDPSLTTMDRYQLDYATREYLGAPHELITQIFSRPEVTAILAKTRASAELKASMNRSGFGGKLQSVWDGFKNVLRDIFRIRSPDSVLDLVLRPLSEITETGARFREGDVAAARRESIMASDHALGPLESRDDWSRRAIQAAARAGDAGNTTWRTLLRGAFHGATLPAIHDMIKPYVPSVTDHFEALANIAHASKVERVRDVVTHDINGRAVAEPNMDKATRLAQAMSDRPELNKLMTEVTRADMSVIDPRRNAHLVTPEQIKEQQEYQQRFNALSPEDQHTYREHNEYRNEIYRAEREASVKNMVEQAFPDLTQAEQNVIREQMRTRQGIADVLNRPDITATRQTLGPKWDSKSDLIRIIAKSQEGGFVNGDYAALRRFGEYVVRAGEENTPSYMVQMFERASEARSFKKDLEAAGHTDVSQVFVKSQTKPRDMVGQAALSTLDRAMDRAGLSDAAKDVLRDSYVGQMIQQGTHMAERTMRREGIAGASLDQSRALLTDFLAYTTRMGHLMHGAEASRTLYQAEKEVRALHMAGTGANERQVALAQTGTEELRMRMAPADGDTSADYAGRGVRALTTWTVLSSLLRPAHYFMQLAGTHTASSSLLAARHGVAGIGALTRAYAQLTGPTVRAGFTNAIAAMNRDMKAANFDLTRYYLERLQRPGSGITPDHAQLLMDRLNQLSLIDHTALREFQRMSGPGGLGGGRFNFMSRFIDVSAAGELALDTGMRVGTAKAAFELELRKNGGNLQGALDYAMKTAIDSQPVYGHYKSRLATKQGLAGRFAPLVTQFKQFGLHMYGVQGNLLATAIRTSSGTERAEAIKALAYLQGSHALLFGVGTALYGSLPAMVGLGLYDYLNPNDPTNRPHTNQELETASRNWVKDITGSRTAADMFAHGVPMAFGANVSRSLQFTNLLGVPELREYTKAGALNFLVQLMTGAGGDQAASLLDQAEKVINGDVRQETIAKIMPRVIRDPWEAYIWGTEGLKTGKGQLIVPAKDFSYGDLALKATGFITSAASTPREVRAAIVLSQHTEKEVKTSLTNRLIQTPPSDRGKVMMEIVRYNASAPPNERITSQMIRSRITEQARANAQPFGGMNVPKTDIRAMRDLTRFANP